MSKTKNAISSKVRRELDAFILKVLEPVTEAELIDTSYNSLIRNTRARAWAEARNKVNYYSALTEVATYLEIGTDRFSGFEFEVNLPKRQKLVDQYRQAIAEQLLTPAFEKKGIEWKKRQALKLKWIPVSAEHVAASIKADEEFLARHPIKRER